MSEELTKAIETIMEGVVFKTSVATTVGTLLTWLLVNIRKTNKKINNSVTKDELDKAKCESFDYTDSKIKIHEDKQVIEIASMKKDITETHTMVTALYNFHLKK